MEVPQNVPLVAESLVPTDEKMPVSPVTRPVSQPPAETIGFMRPSSHGPQLLKLVIEPPSELVAPTWIGFLAHEGGAVVT